MGLRPTVARWEAWQRPRPSAAERFTLPAIDAADPCTAAREPKNTTHVTNANSYLVRDDKRRAIPAIPARQETIGLFIADNLSCDGIHS